MIGNTTRRSVLTGAVTLAATSATGATIAVIANSPIERLWAQAQAIKRQLAGLQAPFEVSGAHKLVGQRYAALVQKLRSRPASQRDVAIVEQASVDGDIRHHLAGWANIQVAQIKSATRNPAFV